MKTTKTDMKTTYHITISDQTFIVETDGQTHSVNGNPVTASLTRALDGSLIFTRDGSQTTAVALPEEDHGYDIQFEGESYHATVLDDLQHRVAQAQHAAEANLGEVTLKSPMPGVVLRIPVSKGEAVSKGDTLIILESMKMENELKSSRDGIVTAVSVSEGASVEKGNKLVTVSDEASE